MKLPTRDVPTSDAEPLAYTQDNPFHKYFMKRRDLRSKVAKKRKIKGFLGHQYSEGG